MIKEEDAWVGFDPHCAPSPAPVIDTGPGGELLPMTSHLLPTPFATPVSLTILLLLVASPSGAQVQIRTDASLGQPAVTVQPAPGTNEFIIHRELGAQSADGSTLFHSFEKFSIDQGFAARFTGADASGGNTTAFNNVVARVTGQPSGSGRSMSPSIINGQLRSDVLRPDGEGASLWLVNPAGVVFGPGAALDLPGSLNVGAADDVRLSDEAQYSAGRVTADLAPPPLLSVASPVAFGFLANNSTSSPLGHLATESARLEVVRGGTLAIVGQIASVGESTRLAAGRIVLASVAGTGAVTVGNDLMTPPEVSEGLMRHATTIGLPGDGLAVQMTAGSVYLHSGDLEISRAWIGAARLDIDADLLHIGSGSYFFSDGEQASVTLRAISNLSLEDSSIYVFDRPTDRPAEISLSVSSGNLLMRGSIEGLCEANCGTIVFGVGQDPVAEIPLPGEIYLFAAGDIVMTRSLTQQPNSYGRSDEFQLLAFTASEGPAPMTRIEAGGSLLLDGSWDGSGRESSGQATGDSGSLFIRAGSGVTISGSLDSAPEPTDEFFGVLPGKTGSIEIDAGQGVLAITDGSFINTAAITDDVQVINGDVRLAGRQVLIGSDGVVAGEMASLTPGREALVQVSALGGSSAGAIRIVATDLVQVRGLVASSATGAGSGGSIAVAAPTVVLDRGGRLDVSTAAIGNGGSVTIDAESMTIDGWPLGAGGQSGVSARGTGVGPAGDIKIRVTGGSIFMRNGAYLSSSAVGAGDAGRVEVTAENLYLDSAPEAAPPFRSSITASSTSGRTGDVTLVISDTLRLDNGVVSNISGDTAEAGGNFCLVGTGECGLGSAKGVANLVLTSGSEISARSPIAGGGNAFLAADAQAIDWTSSVSASGQLVQLGSIIQDVLGVAELATPVAAPPLETRCTAQRIATRNSLTVRTAALTGVGAGIAARDCE